MKNFAEFFYQPRFQRIAVGILALLLFIVYTIFALHFDLITHYPEEKYQLLEMEAQRMVTENDFNSNYHFSITYYNNQTKQLDFNLLLNSATVKTNISNLGQPNQTATITREFPSKILFIIGEILAAAIVYFVLAVILYILLIILYFLVLLFVFIGYKILNKV